MAYNNIRTLIKKYITLEHCVIRIIMAWCFVALIQTLYVKSAFEIKMNKIDFTGKINFISECLIIVIMFTVFYIIFEILTRRYNNTWMEKVLLFTVTIVYSAVCAAAQSSVYFGLAMAGLMVFVTVYCFKDINTQLLKMPIRVYRILMVISLLVFITLIGTCTVLRYLTYSAPNFDLGIFSQMFYNMKTSFTMNTTCERDKLLSHMAVHISPAFYLILPFYMIVSSPATLELMQVIVIGLGIIPLSKICSNHKLSKFETLAVCICYLAYPVMSGGCFYDIHENMFLPLFILTLLYFCEKNSSLGIIISMLLVFSVKEDASIYVAFIAIYMLLEFKQYKKGALMLLASGAYFIFTTVLISKIGEGVMSFRFNNMIYDNNGSMLSIIKTVITNPAFIVTQIMQQEKIEFIFQTLAPLCFMPLFSKKWYRYILLGPYVMFCLMSDYTYFHSVFFQYVFGSGTLLVYLAVVNVSELDMKLRSKAIPMLAVSSVIIFMSVIWCKTSIIETYRSENNRKSYEWLDEAVATIPDDASVTATTFLIPALSERNTLYELYYTDKKTEYIALDLRVATKEYNVDTYLNDSRYEKVYYKAFQVAVFRDKTYKE